MWTGTTSLSQLRRRSRWKVEFFCNENIDGSRSTFDLVALREIVDERKETLNPQVYPDRLFNYVGLENVQPVTGDLVDFEPRQGKKIRSRSKIFRKGDILYGRLRPYLNKVFLANNPVSSGICSGEFYVLIPKSDKVRPHFLRAMLSSKYVQQYVRNLQTGSALPRLQFDDLMEINVPLPPMDVQEKYEEFLIQENTRRRRLAAELKGLPRLILDGLVRAIESNQEPTILDQHTGEIKQEYNNPLPDGEFSRQRR
jgi:type I restriction enzyme S subunit